MAYLRKRYKRRYNKKKGGKGGKFSNYHKSKMGRPSKGLTQSKYFFTRCMTEVRTSLATATSGAWFTNATTTSWYSEFHLGQLTNASDFTSMFDRYRINAVSVEFIPQATNVPQGGRGAGEEQSEFSQLVVYIVPNPQGRYTPTTPLTEQNALDTQATRKRRWVNGKTLKLYTKCKQLGMVYHNSTNTDYVSIKPRLLSTQEPNTPHYGQSVLFVNQNGGSMPTIPVKIITKFYLEFRGAM